MGRSGRPTYGMFSGDDLCGLIALELRAEPWVFSMGYWLDAERRGAGLATEAAAALARLALEGMGAIRVIVSIHPENERSARVPRRLGFVPIGRERSSRDGDPHDLYALDDPASLRAFARRVTVDGKTLAGGDEARAGRALAGWAALCRDVCDHLVTVDEVSDERLVLTRGGVLVTVSARIRERPAVAVVTAPVGRETTLEPRRRCRTAPRWR